jgi:antitoxin (DNA-binding transcriptional repressor) of toxin-antitoxin stability system
MIELCPQASIVSPARRAAGHSSCVTQAGKAVAPIVTSWSKISHTVYTLQAPWQLDLKTLTAQRSPAPTSRRRTCLDAVLDPGTGARLGAHKFQPGRQADTELLESTEPLMITINTFMPRALPSESTGHRRSRSPF